MKRLGLSFLAVALAVSAGAAFAQDYRGTYDDAPYGQYPHRTAPAAYPGAGQDGHYEWARVLRVDPVIGYGSDVRTSGRRNCVTRRDYYAGNDPYRDDRYRDDRYRDDRYEDRDYGGNDPYRDDAYRTQRRDENGRMVATVLGGIAGAVLGSKIGDGSGQYIGTAVGSMVGGMAGRGIYDANRRQRDTRDGYVTTCDPEPYYGGDGYGDGYRTGDRAVSEYDVTYEYAGRQYTTRTNYHPGDRIRVRVDVRPE